MPFARRDIISTTISATDGGCGQTHRRPFINGSPAEVWELNCPQCQAYLTTDPLWSGNLADVPLTYDEKRQEESTNFTFNKNRDDILTMALAKIAGLDTGDLMSRIKAQGANNALVKCPAGHDNFNGTKFCGECGAQMDGGDVSQQSEREPSPTGVAKPAPSQRQPRQTRVPRPSTPPAMRSTPAPRTLEEEITSTPSI